MNDLCAEIGWKSVNHYGEQLCGDHVEVIEKKDGNFVIVLADGLGSGVKASILSTLTSKIISTMISENIPIEECISTIADTLPVDKVREVAYSTFTIINMKSSGIAELIQYDTPHIIFIRDGDTSSYKKKELNIGGKTI
ncbi:MAG: SpoIIE family protein phosphatase, partial [Firmicutes bacterium]|nr:SpoIIE family protein phosphatase [Bacillota bacterium]